MRAQYVEDTDEGSVAEEEEGEKARNSLYISPNANESLLRRRTTKLTNAIQLKQSLSRMPKSNFLQPTKIQRIEQASLAK